MKKLIGRILLVLLLIVAVVSLGLQIDDELEPDVVALLNVAEPHKESKAYLYLMGINASEKDDPLLIGQSVFNSIVEGEEVYLTKKGEFSYQEYPRENHLPIPKGELFCAYWEDGCLAKLFNSNRDLKEVLASHSVLLDRYKKFIEFEEYSTLTRPMLSEPFAPYQYIARGSRLVVLSSIDESRMSNHNRALDLLSENISKLRNQLALQDNLIGKLVVLMQISECLDVAFLISRQAGEEYAFEVGQLTEPEKDFQVLMAREFAMTHDVFRGLDGHPEFWQQDGKVPSWLVRTVFKPNMTTNAAYVLYSQAIEYASLSSGDFLNVMTDLDTPSLKSSILRNSMGATLLKTFGTDYREYIARFHDLDAKIILFNSLLGKKNLAFELGELKTPYGMESSAFFLSEKNKKVCFDGPMIDERDLRCLRVAL